MKILFLIGWILISITLFSITGWMIHEDKAGWGWLLFVGVLFAGGLSYTSGKKYTENDLRNAFDAARETQVTFTAYLESIKKEDEEDDD